MNHENPQSIQKADQFKKNPYQFKKRKITKN